MVPAWGWWSQEPLPPPSFWLNPAILFLLAYFSPYFFWLILANTYLVYKNMSINGYFTTLTFGLT